MEKGSSSSTSSSSSAAASLNFGKKVYVEGAAKSGGAEPPPSQQKKGRTGVVIGGQPPRCQVEGCNVDLSDAKTYYSRHKVCGMHSKSPRVIVAGLEQRFCQQCSRFHQLPEFDQGKRSCRRRLAGHNERRRKPPPGPLSSPRFGGLSSSSFDTHRKTGGFVMDFSAYPALSAQESWPNVTSEQGSGNESTTTATYYQIQWQSNSQDHLLQGSATRPGFSAGPGPSPEEGYSALSLLSNQPWDPRTQGPSSIGVNNFLGANGTTVVQPSVDPDQFASASASASASWGFKGNNIQDDNALHEMPPDLGLGQNPQPANDGQYMGDLGLGQPSGGHFQQLEHSRGYDSSTSQHMHWSL